MLVSLFLSLSLFHPPSPPSLSLSLSLPVLHVFSINSIQDNRSPNEMKRPGQVTHPPGKCPDPDPNPLSLESPGSPSPQINPYSRKFCFVLLYCCVAELKFPREGGREISPGKHYRWNDDESGLPGCADSRIRYTYSSTRVVLYMYLYAGCSC